MAPDAAPLRPDPGAADLRRLLLLVLAVGMLGTVTELVLLEHYEDAPQWIPLVLLVAGIPAVAFALLRPSAGVVRVLRWLMAAYVVAGLLGIWLHFQGNLEFELERGRGLAGLALFWETIRGATPALAPGTMVQIGLFGLLTTWKHPALRPSDESEP